MNILIFSWRDPKHPLAGGAEQVVHEHCKGWIEAGYSVTLFSSKFDNGSEETLDGVNIIRKGGQLLGVQIAAFFWYIFGNHQKFDIVIDQFHGIPFFTPFYIRIKKLALIQEVAREVWFMNHLLFPLNYIIGLIGYITEPIIFLLYKSTPFMTGSNSAKDDLINFGIPEKNITVVPHGVLIQSRASLIKKPKKDFTKEKKKTIVFLGALARDKGVEDAIKTFSLLNNKDGFQFWILGKGNDEYTNFLKDMCSKYGLKQSVKFWGFVDDNKKFELLTRSHLLINPSAREGWGLVNIEANAMGTPVVAYNSPGLIDSVENNTSGIIVEANTPQSLAGGILKILEDKTLYEKLQQGATAWSKQFSWENSQKLSLKLLERVINEKS